MLGFVGYIFLAGMGVAGVKSIAATKEGLGFGVFH